jgi:hypothetical protein
MRKIAAIFWLSDTRKKQFERIFLHEGTLHGPLGPLRFQIIKKTKIFAIDIN